jgi:circadian clock protein KaiC
LEVGYGGSGMTTLGLQFLLEGARRGEAGVYIALSETREEIEAVAASHGWSMDGIQILELSAADQHRAVRDDNTLFRFVGGRVARARRDVVRGRRTRKAKRVVPDSLSELRLLSQNTLVYRRQVLALKTFLAGHDCTLLLIDDRTSESEDRQLQSLAHGVLALECRTLEYGTDRRRIRVVKLRGVSARAGYHEFVIQKGGLAVFPRLVAAEHKPRAAQTLLPSGIVQLDAMLCGGIDLGTSTLIMGPVGSGKSTLAQRYALTAADRGERVAIFAFDERSETMLTRLEGLGMDIRDHIETGRILVRQVDPAEMGPGEQIATNLLTNAIKHTQRGGQVSATVTRKGPKAILCVEDTGLGIAKEHLAAIFDMFSQAPTTSIARAAGSGSASPWCARSPTSTAAA